MRFVRAIVLFPALLVGCGGGGGGGGGSNAERQEAQALLEACGIEAIVEFLDAIDVSTSIVDPAAASLPAIQVNNVDQAGGNIAWSLDTGGDPAPELLGVIQFQDDTGQPAEPPFDLTQFQAAGLGGFDAVLNQLADGWSVTITVNATPPVLVLIRTIFTYTGGVVSDVTANGNIQGLPCGTTFTFTGGTLADFAGAFPNLGTNSNYGSPDTTLAGTTDFDGTDTATVECTVDGGTATYRFAVDLGAMTVTPLP
ncbi:MAG TPA: hypothetical protein VFY93_12590 [Planctomycetota bacterium]|nr:hypothetical protein [Planctomycetota bacterium]